MNYEVWLAEVPESLKCDPVWKFAAYSKSLWLFDLVWKDCERLRASLQGKALISQLVRSTDSISANIDEGYGRGLDHKEYAYYLRVALGSTRETRSRYFKARQSFPGDVVQHRMGLCNEIIGLLVNAINNHRFYLKRLKHSKI